MKKYAAHTLFQGFKIGLDNAFLHVGAPEKLLDHSLMVVHKPEAGVSRGYMVIPKGAKPLTRIFQEGRKGLPDFWLAYFKFVPYQKKSLEVEVAPVMSNTYAGFSKQQKDYIKSKLFRI